MCERFDTLPNAGGIMDQDHLLLRKVGLVLDALNERRSKEAEKPKNKGN